MKLSGNLTNLLAAPPVHSLNTHLTSPSPFVPPLLILRRQYQPWSRCQPSGGHFLGAVAGRMGCKGLQQCDHTQREHPRDAVGEGDGMGWDGMEIGCRSLVDCGSLTSYSFIRHETF